MYELVHVRKVASHVCRSCAHVIWCSRVIDCTIATHDVQDYQLLAALFAWASCCQMPRPSPTHSRLSSSINGEPGNIFTLIMVSMRAIQSPRVLSINSALSAHPFRVCHYRQVLRSPSAATTQRLQWRSRTVRVARNRQRRWIK